MRTVKSGLSLAIQKHKCQFPLDPLKILALLPTQAVEVFLRDRLQGAGDIMRHLASKGFKLEYHQDLRSEFDFRIQNLAVDLRDGMRLSKLVDILTGPAETLAPSSMAPPAILSHSFCLLPKQG